MPKALSVNRANRGVYELKHTIARVNIEKVTIRFAVCVSQNFGARATMLHTYWIKSMMRVSTLREWRLYIRAQANKASLVVRAFKLVLPPASAY